MDRFYYGDSVAILPLDRHTGRVVEVHLPDSSTGQSKYEYSVRYFHEGRAETVRFFHDELERKSK